MYFNVNFKLLTKLITVHLLVRELHINPVCFKIKEAELNTNDLLHIGRIIFENVSRSAFKTRRHSFICNHFSSFGSFLRVIY